MGRDWKKAKFVVFTFEDLVMWREGGQGKEGVQQGVRLGGSRANMVSLPIQRLSDCGAAGNPLRRCLFHPVTFRAVSSAAATLSQHPTQHNSTIVAPHKPTKPLRRTFRFKPDVPPDGPVQQAGRQQHRWDTGFVLFSSH